MHILAGTELVPDQQYALPHFMHCDVMHYKVVNCTFKFIAGLIATNVLW
jgi:hypothetical protein